MNVHTAENLHFDICERQEEKQTVLVETAVIRSTQVQWCKFMSTKFLKGIIGNYHLVEPRS